MFCKQTTMWGTYIWKWTGPQKSDEPDTQFNDSRGQTYIGFDFSPTLF